MASKRGLTFKLCDFLKYRGWKVKSYDGLYVQLFPPNEIVISKQYLLKIGKNRSPVDYCDHMDIVLNIVGTLYIDIQSTKTINKYKKINSLNRRKYLTKDQWIINEESVIINKLKESEIYIPNFRAVSFNLITGEPH